MEGASPPRAFDHDVPAPPARGRLLGFMAGSLGVLALLAALAGSLLFANLEQRTADLHAMLSARLEAEASGTAQVLATWLDGTARVGQRLTRSDLVRLFASEMATTRPNQPPDRWLADQIPYMTQLIGDFVIQHGLLGATLLGRDGRILLASRDAPLPARRSWAERVARLEHPSGPVVTPIRALAPRDPAGADGPTLALDLLLPVSSAPRADNGEARSLSAILVMTAAIDGTLAEAVAGGPGTRLRLIQPGADGPEQVVLAPEPAVVPLDGTLPLSPGDAMAYGSVPTPGGRVALAAGAPVPDLPWTVVRQLDADTALAPLQAYRRSAAAVAASAALGVGLAFGAFWWRQRGARERELARQRRLLDGRLHEQRQRSQGVLDAIPDMVAVKAQDGPYLHVNRAFAKGLGRPPEEIVGQVDADLFPAGTAGLLAEAGAQACRGAPVPPLCIEAELAGQRRRLAVSIGPLEGAGGEALGLVMVARDASAQHDGPQQAGQQAAAALVRAIGLHDAFLLDHTERLSTYARTVGERLGLSESERATLELAASVSQIGKIFMPGWLLAKAGRETPDETRVMQAHLCHALEVIGTVDFGLPVREAIAQMHERLDGSGYPHGLRGEQIGVPARVLGAIDAFCARTASRGAHGHDTPGQALYHLAQNAQRYDVKVIKALAAVIAVEGQEAPSLATEHAGPGRTHRQAMAEAAA